MKAGVIVSMALVVCLFLAPAALAQAPLGTAFTYQGQVKQGGLPVTNTADFQFSLWDAATTPPGLQVGTTQSVNGASVTNGLFTVTLDFGAGVFIGDVRWLEIAVRAPAGGGPYTTLSPRQEITPAPYALYALNGGGGEAAWALTGNAGTVPGTNFLGTTDNQPLILKVNGGRAMRVEPASTPNLIGGHADNDVASGKIGCVIAGGGSTTWFNQVEDDYCVVGGGRGNVAGYGPADPAAYATVAGGYQNYAQGAYSAIGGGRSNYAKGQYSCVLGGREAQAGADYSFAAGRRAKVRSPADVGYGDGDVGTFVWADSTDADFTSYGTNKFLIRAAGGVGINTNSPWNDLDVEGRVAIGASYSGTSFAPADGLIVQGNVGIGTPTPANKLDVEGGAAIGASYSGTSAAPPNGLIVEGNVGIGTATPKQRLHVAGDYYGKGSLWLHAYQGDGASGTAYVQARDDSGTSNIDLVLRTQNAGTYVEALKLENTGAVGIGETSPLAKLHVQNVDLGVTSGMTFDTLLVESSDAQFGLYSNPSGSWGSGLSLAEVDAGVLVNKWGLVRQTGASGLMKVSFGTEANPANNPALMTFLTNGNVGIGVDPTEKLDTSGTARLRGIGTSTGTTVVADANGKLWKQSSSLRYKHNISDLPPAGDAVLDLRPVAFEWNSTGAPDIGLIAEEVATVLPDLVIRDAEGRPDGVRYDKVALYLFDVVKAQRDALAALRCEKDAEIAAHSNKLAAQDQELSELRTRLARLEELAARPADTQTGGGR